MKGDVPSFNLKLDGMFCSKVRDGPSLSTEPSDMGGDALCNCPISILFGLWSYYIYLEIFAVDKSEGKSTYLKKKYLHSVKKLTRDFLQLSFKNN